MLTVKLLTGSLAERTRVRQAIEALHVRLAELDDEFIKRALSAWAQAVQTEAVR